MVVQWKRNGGGGGGGGDGCDVMHVDASKRNIWQKYFRKTINKKTIFLHKTLSILCNVDHFIKTDLNAIRYIND